MGSNKNHYGNALDNYYEAIKLSSHIEIANVSNTLANHEIWIIEIKSH